MASPLDFSVKRERLSPQRVSPQTVRTGSTSEEYASSEGTDFHDSDAHSPQPTVQSLPEPITPTNAQLAAAFNASALTQLLAGLNGSGLNSPTSPTPPSTSPYAYLPTTSLAMSTLQRRRRNTTQRGVSASSEEGGCKEKGSKEVQKDDQYWERRRRNNEAAKRSRDTRRIKENEIALRATLLEQENLRLRAELNVLKQQTTQLHLVLYEQSQRIKAAGLAN